MTTMLNAGFLGLLILVPQCPAHAADVQPRELTLTATGATDVKGKIKGDQSVRYLLRANATDEYAIELETRNPSAYFNINQAGRDDALHIGSIAGNSFKGRLPVAGEYTISVYLMRSAARRNGTATYTLRVSKRH